MIQVCDPPRQRQVRRLSAEEFFTLVRCGGAGFYRPRTEVLRMLTAGEAWGTAGAALLVLPSPPIPPPQRHCAAGWDAGSWKAVVCSLRW
mgnify:CR=1 FL=1